MAKCTGVRCPMQYGYKVDECNHTDCPYRTEPVTNADRIRAMSDRELAWWLAERYAKEAVLTLRDKGVTPSATEIKAVTERLYMTWARWLMAPAEAE